MARKLGCVWVGAVEVDYRAVYEYNDCHNSVIDYVSIYGGRRRLGYYFVESPVTLQAIYHSVWESPEGKLIDVVPYKDGRTYNIVGLHKQEAQPNYQILNCYSKEIDRYPKKREPEKMYYVYQLVDPRNGLPFYVGKGKGTRFESHLQDKPDSRNKYKENKIASIRNDGFEPEIVYVAENIIDETLAYEIEERLIIEYKRNTTPTRKLYVTNTTHN